jgi:phosphoribosyl 1,2-cyclic phosphodiesterase
VSASTASSFAILGTGSFAPARIVTNDDLSKVVATSDEWIHTRTGIRERRLAGPEDTTTRMASGAARAALADAGLRPEDIDLLIVTHEHSDHILGLPVIGRTVGKPIYCTHLTAEALDWDEIRTPKETFAAGTGFQIGDIEIGSFTIPHDAVDPVGYTVRADGVRAAVVTDLGYMPDSIKMHLRGMDLLLLESNHNLEMLKVGPYPWSIKQRIMGRKGHLSNDAAYDFITQDMDSSVSTLILGHLSENTNYPTLVEQMAV